uniref:Uncharacterized protein n=1 Tax=Arundo donax TaxID=35708 RepID=A0A0A9T1X0_ARUDO
MHILVFCYSKVLHFILHCEFYLKSIERRFLFCLDYRVVIRNLLYAAA